MTRIIIGCTFGWLVLIATYLVADALPPYSCVTRYTATHSIEECARPGQRHPDMTVLPLRGLP